MESESPFLNSFGQVVKRPIEEVAASDSGQAAAQSAETAKAEGPAVPEAANVPVSGPSPSAAQNLSIEDFLSAAAAYFGMKVKDPAAFVSACRTVMAGLAELQKSLE